MMADSMDSAQIIFGVVSGPEYYIPFWEFLNIVIVEYAPRPYSNCQGP